jgi:hypothetical protein
MARKVACASSCKFVHQNGDLPERMLTTRFSHLSGRIDYSPFCQHIYCRWRNGEMTMNIMTKSLLSAGAAAAALGSVAAPAQARDRYDRDHISAGEVIAGAVILGGLAAVVASADNDRDRDRYGYDRYERDGYDYNRSGYDRGYGYDSRYGGGRSAVNQCVNSVERWASRYSRSDVTEIRNIDRTRYGYKVTGKLVVRDGWRGNGGYERGGYDRYDRDRYGYGNGYNRGYDQGRFTCYVERGQVVDVRYSGLDQWR